MKVGIATFAAEGAIEPHELGRAVEERGFDSLFLGEHTHMPASRPPDAPGSLPWYYYRPLDPFLALSAAATTTEHIALGTAICLVVQRDPITLAKEVASIDTISHGRFQFGIGTGWQAEEIANHGTDPATRGALFRERVLAMQAIWTSELAEFHGRYVDFSPLYSWPKPVQHPHPPVLVGGNGPKVIDRVLAFGDGWIPMAFDLESLTAPIADLRARASDAGRGPLPVTVCALAPTVENLARADELGIARVLFAIDAAPADDTARQLDDLTTVAAPYLQRN
jgi:probable F420-dependent oxidoreductase